MAKKKIKRKLISDSNLYSLGGDVENNTPSSSEPSSSTIDTGNTGKGVAIGNKVGAVAGAVTDIAKTGLSNAQIADTSGIESEIDKARSYVVQANDNDALMSEWDAFTPMKSIDWRDIRGGSTGQRIGNTIGATASGASSGFTVGGPVGAVVGGVIGLGSAIGGWFGGNRKAKNKASSLNKQINIANSRNLLALSNRADTIDTQNDLTKLANYSAYGGPITMRYTGVMSPFGNTFEDGGIFIKPENRGKFTALKERTGKSSTWYKEHGTPAQKKMATFSLNAAKWKHADGGELHTHGGDFTNGLTYIDNGGSHEANPFEGVQMGIDPQGVPNLVEEGEVIFNDYVFSNRLKVPKTIRQKYKLRDNITFADAAKKLSKESEDRPNDPISKRGLESFMSALAESQEEVRISKELHKAKNNKFAYGGSIKDILEEFKTVSLDDYPIWIKNNPDKREALGVLMYWLHTTGMNPGLDLVAKKEVIDKIESIYDQLDDLDKEEIEKEIEERIQHLNNGYDYFKNDFYNKLVDSYDYSRSGTLGGLRSSPIAVGKTSSYIDKAIAKYGMEKPLSEITEDEWKKIYEDSQKEFENSILYGTDADNSNTKQKDIRDIPGLDFPYMSMSQLGSISKVPNIEVKNTPLDTSYIAYRTESELNDDDFTMEGASMPEITITPDVTGFNVQDRKYSIGFPSITPRNNNRSTTYIAPLDIQEDEGIGIPLDITRNFSGLEFPSMEQTDNIPVIEGLSTEKMKPLKIKGKKGNLLNNSYLRYAPIAASGIAVLNDILGGNEPNYTNADIFAKAIRDSYRPVSTRPIGEYLSYKPFDRMFYINQLNKNSAANRRAIQNTSGGNRAAALASLLASDYNYGENLGKLGRQAEEYNQALKEKATDFNRRTNMYNSEQGTKVDMFNSELKAKQASLYGQLAGMRQSILNSNMEEKRENMTNFIQGLGDLGREMEQKQWRKALYNTGYFGKSKELEQLLGII